MSEAIIHSDAVSFDGQDFPSKALSRLLNVLGVSTLKVSVDSCEREKSSKDFKLIGSAEVHDKNVKVSLYFEHVKDDKFEFQFRATLPSLTLKTLQDATILPASPFVEPLLTGRYQDVQVVFDSENERLYLACLESSEHVDRFPGLSLRRLGFEFLRSYVDETKLVDIYAEIKIGSTPIEVKIEIPLGGSLSSKYWTLMSRSSIPLGSWLSDLTTFLLDTVGAKDVFPESVKSSVGSFFVDDVQILLDPASKSLKFLSFRIQSVDEFRIVDSLAISRVGMRVTVIPAKPQARVSLTLFGHIKITEDANLDIQVMLPPNLSKDDWDFCLSGSVNLKNLTEIKQLPVGHKVEELHLHPGFLTLESLELKKFEVAFSPLQKTVSSIAFDLEVIAECELVHGFKLKDPRFELIAQDPFNQCKPPAKSLEGALAGVIAIGNEISVAIEARKLRDGWEFSGKTAQAIHLSKLVTELEGKYQAPLPEIIKNDSGDDWTLESLDLKFTTTAQAEDKSTKVTFSSKFDFPISHDSNSRKASLSLDAHFTDEGKDKYKREFGGLLTIGDSVGFGLRFSKDTTDSFFVGASSNTEVKFSELIKSVSSQLADLIPDGLGITVKDAVFAFAKSGQDPRKFLFGMDLGLKCNLSLLPLVGKYFSGAENIGVENLKIVFASQPFVQKEVQNLNQLLSTFEPAVSQLPDIAKTTEKTTAAGDAASPDEKTPVLKRGVNVAAVLNFGGSAKPLSFPASPQTQQSSSSSQSVPNATTGDSAIWLNIQKAIGPVHVERVGVEYRKERLWVLLSASLTAAGLIISLDGLSLGSRLDKIDLAVDLRGLGIDYRNDAVEIGGSFSKTPAADANSADEYSGAVTLKARTLTISAFGKYTTLEGKPSLFIYGRLDYPIGGPPFFFVTGLTAGFGYQRKLVMPSIENLGQFSLIAASKKGSSFNEVVGTPNLAKEIPPAAGEYFLAAGVIFTSFKIVESTVLLFASFGKRFELNLLGLSRLRMPAAIEGAAAVDPVAEVELAVKGSFIPDIGFLELRAQLTPTSYLFSKDCHLAGGFAFLCWFKPKPGIESTGQEGDFVLTLGGYHPDFHKPSNYPTVPRLGFNWQVIPDRLSLSGEVYFALTPAAVMAGGYLQAEWHSGKVRAWFKAGVDFLIAWKPYHYDAHAYIDIGVEVTFEFFGTQRLSLDVGADLHIWGPEFAGDATIHLWIISFTIHFGKQEPSKEATIEWGEFQISFLLKEKPKPKELKAGVCSVVVSDGLVRKVDGQDLGVINANDLGVINAKHFCLTTDSRIPATVAECNGTTLAFDKKLSKTFGVAPVGIESVKTATHSITLKRDGQPVGNEFKFKAIAKNFPAALWGQSSTPQVNGPQFINALSGFEISSQERRESVEKATIRREELVNHDSKPQHCWWGAAPTAFNSVKKTEQQFKDDLKTVNSTMRNALLKTVGVNFSDLDDELTYQFFKQPQSEAT